MSGDWDLDTDWSNNGYQSGPARVANTVSVFSGLYNRLEQSVTSRQLTLKQYVLASLSLAVAYPTLTRFLRIIRAELSCWIRCRPHTIGQGGCDRPLFVIK